VPSGLRGASEVVRTADPAVLIQMARRLSQVARFEKNRDDFRGETRYKTAFLTRQA
jgi:hypothetical protein